jgi:hypothetical protein
MKLSKFALFMLCVFLISCSAGKTNRVAIDTDEPFSDVETSSKDLGYGRSKNDSLTSSAFIKSRNAKTPVRIAFADVKNETNEIINKNLFIEKMRTLLA